MKYIVLDTNILVSGLINTKGKPALIIDEMLDHSYILCYDRRIKAEYDEVLYRENFPFEESDAADLIDFIEENGPFITGVTSSNNISNNIHFTDESDRAFYDIAKLCGATLITGNKRHYPDEPFIMTPAEFLDMLDTRESEVQEASFAYNNYATIPEFQELIRLIEAKDIEIAELKEKLNNK